MARPAIKITDDIKLSPDEVAVTFIRASGPGGQKVNKVATAVQLRFDVAASPSLPRAVALRARRLAGRRLTKDGVIVITAERYRTQERNREDALDRLVGLLRKAAVRPTRRRPTKPSKSARARRTDAKTRRGATKRLRKQPNLD